MRRTDRLAIRDPRAEAVLLGAWTLESSAAQDDAAQAALTAMRPTHGLLRYSVFCGVDDLTLLHVSQWTDGPARDVYLADSSRPRITVDTAVPDIRRDWREPATRSGSTVIDETLDATCLVAIRQPLERPDPYVQQAWIDRIITALGSDSTPQPGLRAATFFASSDGAMVFNLAEWTDADAHRAALEPTGMCGRESLGDSAEWRAAHALPGIRAEHDVRRYTLVGAVEPDRG
jgi:hypothetical protein